ncbi:A/B/D/E cyclin [Agrocybe pediades]|nr:A/B/D/E cyclin [Agrocybe pediades]
MSSIPVRRTTRVVRSTKDNENANARPSRLTSRAKSALGGATTATSATSRATASTVASKAKAIASDAKEEAGVKRKREALVEVTGLVTNNKPAKSTVASGKGKDAIAVEKAKEAPAVKASKPAVKPPARRALAGVATRRSTRATTESTAVSSSKPAPEPVFKPQPTVEHAAEEMDVDEPQASKVEKVDEEEVQRVFKRRHTDEKPIVHAKQVLDDSQADADKVAAELEAVGEQSGQLWEDLDAEDWDDPASVSEYVKEVCVYLKEIELATMPDPDYMKMQTEVTWEHRGVLIDWILQVHAKFNLLSESLFLCINILDRFLGMRPISLKKLQLVGLASFFIATKYEETYAPSVKEVAYLAENLFTVDEILKAERYILKTINWDLRAPGPMGWLRRGSKADNCELHARTIAKYLLEIAYIERRLLHVVPSKAAAASLWLARLTLGRDEWTPTLEHYTTYSEKEILPIASIMLEYIITDPVQHDSLFRKYASKRYFKCSAYMQVWALDRWPPNADVNLANDLDEIKEEIRRHREMLPAEGDVQEAL